MSRAKKAAPASAEKPPRGCIVCGRLWTQPEFGWDEHLRGEQMLTTCSHECRRKAGFKERIAL